MAILDGKTIAQNIKNTIKEQIIKEKINPLLVVIRVGDDKASETYVKSKQKASQEVGIAFQEIHLSQNISEEEIINIITNLNQKKEVSAILVQLPLPKNINTRKVINTIDYKKDVDGLTDINKVNLLNNAPHIIPCTPLGIIRILKEYQIPIQGKHVVIIGRSNLVGRPLIDLFLSENATVTICHSHTPNLKEYTLQADILISAVGKKEIIKKDMINPQSTVIDVGINKENGIIYGDIAKDAEEVAANITPVPGGIGPMTVAMLLENTVKCHKGNNN